MIASKQITKTQEAQLQKHLAAIDSAKASYNDSVIVIGRELSGIREILPAKEFVPWVEQHCNFKKSTAYNYLAAFERFGNFKRLENFETSAIYLLAPNEAASNKAKELASKGQRIDEPKARGLLANSKPPKTKPSAIPTVGMDDGKNRETATPLDSVSKADVYTCSNCGGHEADDDGDCAKCHEPAPPAAPAPEAEPAGGYEPVEAKKHLDKLADLIGKAAREHAEAVKILGPSQAMGAVFSGLDTASIALTKFRAAFKRNVK